MTYSIRSIQILRPRLFKLRASTVKMKIGRWRPPEKKAGARRPRLAGQKEAIKNKKDCFVQCYVILKVMLMPN